VRAQGHFDAKISSVIVPQRSAKARATGRDVALTSFSGLSGQAGAQVANVDGRSPRATAARDEAAAAHRINDRTNGRYNCARPPFEEKEPDMTRTAKILHLAALTAAAALFIATTTQATAQSQHNCGPRAAVVAKLAEGYGETRQSVGIGSNNAMVEVFASDATGSWTILVTQPTGLSCLVASGQSYEQVAEALPAKGNDA